MPQTNGQAPATSPSTDAASQKPVAQNQATLDRIHQATGLDVNFMEGFSSDPTQYNIIRFKIPHGMDPAQFLDDFIEVRNKAGL